jgi:N-acetylmuramic acid 6-phosphate etherase
MTLDNLLTEQRNPATMSIDGLSTLEIVTLINAEDAKVAEVVRGELPNIAHAVDLIVERLRAGGRLFYVGTGTSGRLGVLDASEIPPTFSAPPTLVQGIIAGGVPALTRSSEGLEDYPEFGARDLIERGVTGADVVVGLASSGRTPYVLGALAKAREIGCATIGIVCTRSAALAEHADVLITLLVGPEVVTGSTRLKAGTAQKMVLNMLSTTAMIRLGKVYGNLMVDLRPSNSKLRARARRIIRTLAGISDEEAVRLLAASGDEVKVALVMALRGVDADEARRRLQEAGGLVRQALA